MSGRIPTGVVPAIHPPVACRRLRVAAAITACALAITGCGASGSDSTQTGSGASGFLAFSTCMRSHGVPNFPDPSAGGGIHLPDGSNLNPASPSFRAARAQCQKLLPGGGPPGAVTEQQKEQLVQTSACMRSHGVTGFPDPTTAPPANPRDYSIATGFGGPHGGLFLLVPKTIDVNSPAFRRAAKACSFH